MRVAVDCGQGGLTEEAAKTELNSDVANSNTNPKPGDERGEGARLITSLLNRRLSLETPFRGYWPV